MHFFEVIECYLENFIMDWGLEMDKGTVDFCLANFKIGLFWNFSSFFKLWNRFYHWEEELSWPIFLNLLLFLANLLIYLLLL